MEAMLLPLIFQQSSPIAFRDTQTDNRYRYERPLLVQQQLFTDAVVILPRKEVKKIKEISYE